MTEEIIIDGVNVSECCFYNNSKCDNPNGMACNCINNAVRYFKELKRLEQELDVLKGKYFLVEQESINKSKTICDLERENKELKKQIESQKGLITVGGKQQYEYLQKIDELEQENKELKSDVLKWQKAFSRQYQINENKGYSKAEENYRSALEEINITVKQLLKGVSSNCINNTPYLTALSLIETKINEVLND